MKVIQLKNVSEMYRIKFSEEGKTYWDDFWPLKDISFDVEEGQTVGIIGANGSGKSTILKLIAGMLKPDKGEVIVQGKVSGLLELGAGFELEMTGRENIYTLASLYGLNQKQIKSKFKEITEFADIGRFINAPVKCYSQGMFVRLAFAIAINMDTNILLIDDTLAVGDEYFQRKCIKKILELKEQGKAIIFVTHDMQMLSRLCKRVVFLKDGKIIKDDSVDKVIPLYSQMIGEKQGIGILEKRPLNLIFNNGRILLNWQDKVLTPHSGAHTSFYIFSKWHSSLQADWQIRQEGENKIVAIGTFYQLALTQIWRLEITDNYEIKWDIELDSEEPLEIQEGFINIMLTNEYAQWFTPLEKSKFPLIMEQDKNWQAFLDGNIFRRCLGVEAKEISENRLPSLVFEQLNFDTKACAQILNTDYLTNCRVLQYKMQGLQNYSGTQANHLNYFSGRIMLDIPDIDNYLKNLKDEFVLSNGKLRLAFDNGRIILSYNGINLTKAGHIFTSIYANAKWHSSNLGHWEIKKEKNNKLIAKGIWRDLPIVQVWEIKVIGESSFLWKVSLLVNKEVNIEHQFAQFMYSEVYKYWLSEYGTGAFPPGFLETEMDMLQRCICDGAIGLQGENNQSPALSLTCSKELNNFAKIFNSDFYNKARILRIEKVESEKDIKFLAGEFPVFEIKAFLDKNKPIYAEDSKNILQKGKLKFIFDKGTGRLYWDGVELTKKLGLYTSLRSQGRWHDSSSSAIWKIEEKSNDTIKAFGKWLHLPMSQYWAIRLMEDKLIEFSVKMKVDKEIEIDRLQANLMFSEMYSQWLAAEDKGFFPPFKADIDDDWDCLWAAREGSQYVGISQENKELPAVLFYPQEFISGWFLRIVNSDIYHRGRVLQYLNSNKTQMPVGQYSYFSGKITIDS